MPKQTILQQTQIIKQQSEGLKTFENLQTKHLYDQVIRKNNETIKNLLGKLSIIYSRQQDLEEALKSITQRMNQLNQREDNFQYQLRSAQLETKKQQNIINNDISVIKNVLKIPSLTTPHQVYLSSNFFQERVGALNIRRRDAKNRTLISSVADESSPQLINRQQMPINFTRTRHFKHRSQFPCNQSYTNNNSQATKTQQNEIQSLADANRSTIGKLQVISKEMECYIKKEQFIKQFSMIQANIEQKIDKIDQKKLICNWHLDFQQIKAYIEKIVSQTLSQKVGKKYFEESLSNLKQAWQIQEKEIFEKLDLKLEQSHLSQIFEKIQEIQMKINQAYTLNSFRIPNITFSNQVTPKGTPSRQSIKQYFRADSYDTKISRKKKNQLKNQTKDIKYSNTLSTVGCCIDKKQTSIPWQGSTIQNSIISQNQWKIRASALVEPALVKKLKNRKENIN